MKPIGRVTGTAISIAIALAGCQTMRTLDRPIDVHEAMTEWIDPAAVIVWSIGSRAMSEASGSRETRMDDKSWSSLAAASEQLALSARRLANGTTIRVGAHNDDLEGFTSGPEIQAMIDADPDGFRRLALEAAAKSEDLTVAARMKDIQKSQELTKSLYDNCRACHSRYWERTGG